MQIINDKIITELDKVKETNFEVVDNKIFIKKKVGIKLEENSCYLIRLSNFMLNPPANDLISINWNGGIIPKFEYYKADIIKIVNNMVRIVGIGYDINSDNDLSSMWEGWIPTNEFEIVKKL